MWRGSGDFADGYDEHAPQKFYLMQRLKILNAAAGKEFVGAGTSLCPACAELYGLGLG
jgi:hypothetical protein